MTYEDALLSALPEHRDAIVAARARWLGVMRRTLDELGLTAKNRLSPAHAAAVALQIEMQRDLLGYMPDPLAPPGPDDGKRTSPGESVRARDEIKAVGRLIEWLLFRKYDRSAEQIACLLDMTETDRATDAYCQSLSRLEADVARRMRPTAATTGPTRRAPVLRVVTTDD